MIGRKLSSRVLVLVGMICFGMTETTKSATFPYDNTEIGKYLLIGLGSSADVDDAIDGDNVELGSHKAPAPIFSSFANDSAFGPALLGNVPNIPTMALPVFGGIDHSGNIALTHSTGRATLSNAGVYADTGIVAAASAASANGGFSSAFYYDTSFTDDPNNASDGAGGFPNTLDSFGLSGTENNTTSTATEVAVGDVPSSFDLAAGNGLTGSATAAIAALNAELAALKDASTGIRALSAGDLDGNGNAIHFATLNLNPSGGVISKVLEESGKEAILTGPITGAASGGDKGMFKLSLDNTGLTVIDIVSSSDIDVTQYSFIIDGPVGAETIIRVPTGADFKISSGNVLAGTSGIGLSSITIFKDENNTDTHFNFNQGVVNGIAFWDLGMGNGTINLQDVQGCAQFIGDNIDMSNVRFVHCGSGGTAPIPEPGTLMLAALGGLAIVCWRGGRTPQT